MSESKLQIAMVKWFGYFYPKRFICAIPNGGNRSPITGAILKAEGVRAGVADLFLMEASGEFHGLWIEVKLPKGRQSDKQKEFQQIATERGYKYIIVRSMDEFKDGVNDYLQNKI
jgi:hypothetical protein